MPLVPFRQTPHDTSYDPDDFISPELEMGHMSTALEKAEISRTQRRKWAREDRERDRRRIKPGFRVEGSV